MQMLCLFVPTIDGHRCQICGHGGRLYPANTVRVCSGDGKCPDCGQRMGREARKGKCGCGPASFTWRCLDCDREAAKADLKSALSAAQLESLASEHDAVD